MKNLLISLIKFQKHVKPIPKNKINPFYNSSYAELSTVIDICLPSLNEYGLAVVQIIKIIPETGDNVLSTVLCHESGETLESNIFLPKILDAQKLTGAITYLRRTSYLSILGLVADDDLDGNDIVSKPAPQAARPVEVTQQVTSYPASDAQKNALKKMNIPFNDNITKSEASNLIAQGKK
jgi:hypothetical protein